MVEAFSSVDVLPKSLDVLPILSNWKMRVITIHDDEREEIIT